MIDAIFRVLPDWAVSILCVALIWYGAHYLFLSDIALRDDLKVLRADREMSEGLKNCMIPIIVSWIGRNKVEYALHTATFSFVPSEDTMIARMTNDNSAAIQQCVGR